MMVTLEELKAVCREQTPELFEQGHEVDLLDKVRKHAWHHTWQALVERGVAATRQFHAISKDLVIEQDLKEFEAGEIGYAVADAHTYIASLFRQWQTELEKGEALTVAQSGQKK